MRIEQPTMWVPMIKGVPAKLKPATLRGAPTRHRAIFHIHCASVIVSHVHSIEPKVTPRHPRLSRAHVNQQHTAVEHGWVGYLERAAIPRERGGGRRRRGEVDSGVALPDL